MPLRAVAVTTAPRTIKVGISCGMDSCGENPCLCGAPVDRWGDCACNGLRAVTPSLSVTSADRGVVRVVSVGHRHWLVPTGVGSTTVTVRASMVHYTSAEAAVVVTVSPAAFVALGLVAVALIGAAGGVALVIVLGLRRRSGRRREGAG